VRLRMKIKLKLEILDQMCYRFSIGGTQTKNRSRSSMMKKLQVVFLAILVALATKSLAQENAPLRLLQTIPRPGVQRQWDHFSVDLKGHRLFLASTRDPVVEVFDLRTNKLIHTITDVKGPHNILFRPDVNKIFVVDGEAAEIKIFQYDSYKLIGRIELTIDSDPVAYDPATKYLYVVNGGRAAHTPYCLISVVDTTSGKKLADMKLDTNRLESMAIEKSGSRLFVNMTGVNEIGVVDREKRVVVQTWPITAGKENVPMAFDEARHRLFVATRTPSRVVVFDTETGKEVTSVPAATHADDLAYDAAHQRLYVACGEGFVTVIKQGGADDYQVIGNIPTAPGAKNAILVPELNRYYVNVPSASFLSKGVQQEAKILVYEVAP
jgi:DNA-binding beta-propeller fold protein YncE